MESLTARESAGAWAPSLYLPVSTPCASGDQTICETPFAADRGMTFSSGCRCSREYCGWLETNFSTPRSANAASICSWRPLAEADYIAPCPIARLRSALPWSLPEACWGQVAQRGTIDFMSRQPVRRLEFNNLLLQSHDALTNQWRITSQRLREQIDGIDAFLLDIDAQISAGARRD